MFSFRRYIIASAALFAVFSVACAFTHNLPSMIAMRGLLGPSPVNIISPIGTRM